MSFGLSDTGLTIPTLAEIRDSIEARVRGKFGTSLELGDQTIEGQKIAIQAEREAAVWELVEILYGCIDRDKATGQALRALCLLTGTIPPPPSYSAVVLTWTGDPVSNVPEGSQAKVPSSDRTFETLEAVDTSAALPAWAGAMPYNLADRVTNVGNVYQCTTSGTSAGSGGPTGTEPGVDIVDNGAHWIFLGEGTSAADVAAKAAETGPTEGVANTVVEIVTPVAGIAGVVNLLDAELGTDDFKDPELRILAEVELAQGGAGTVPAIRTSLAETLGVTEATVFYNNTDDVDADGMPPHSVEALVTGGDDETLAQVLFESVAAGIRIHGTTTVAHVDSEGTSHDIKFSRPEDVEIYVKAKITIDEDSYPDDGDDQVAEAIAERSSPTGLNAVASAISAAVFAVEGVNDCFVKISLAPGPTLSTTIPITKRQRAAYDTGRVTVVATPGEP